MKLTKHWCVAIAVTVRPRGTARKKNKNKLAIIQRDGFIANLHRTLLVADAPSFSSSYKEKKKKLDKNHEKITFGARKQKAPNRVEKHILEGGSRSRRCRGVVECFEGLQDAHCAKRKALISSASLQPRYLSCRQEQGKKLKYICSLGSECSFRSTILPDALPASTTPSRGLFVTAAHTETQALILMFCFYNCVFPRRMGPSGNNREG